ncbi:MAG: hypothetical protein CMJ23_05870 [Phycisphaerae bacterium]|nr:hypothetical protein [Phycisphaerae bacterium]
MRRPDHFSWLATAITLLSIASCAPPVPSGGFDAPDPASRIYAAVGVAEQFQKDGARPDLKTLQDLIRMLASADPAARLVAGDTLRMVTGVNFGYRASAPLAERVAATNRWIRWADALAQTSETKPKA